MNNNNKLFGVLVVALLAFGAIGTGSAQQGFNTFVEYGNWEFDIDTTDAYCELGGTPATSALGDCQIFTTNTEGNYTKGDLYMGLNDTTDDVEEGFLRLFNEHGFEAGSVVMEDDSDEGASLAPTNKTGNGVGEPFLKYQTITANGALDTVEADAGLWVARGASVVDDDLSLADNERADDHDLEGAALTTITGVVRVIDLDDDNDYDAGEVLFVDADTSGGLTEGDLYLTGDAPFTLAEVGDSFLANPGLVSVLQGGFIHNTSNVAESGRYFLAILDEQDDYENNGYRGEDLVLITNASSSGFSEPRVDERGWVLTGDRSGEYIEDGHPYHEEVFADTNKTTHTNNEEAVVFCALVEDGDEDPITPESRVFLHFDTECSGDAEEGDVDLLSGEALTDQVDGDLVALGANNSGQFNGSLWHVLDLDGDSVAEDGEPLIYDADNSGTVTVLDLVFSEDGTFLAGPGYEYMAVRALAQTGQDSRSASAGTFEWCTFYIEEEDENGDDIWVAHGIHIRSPDVTLTEGHCGDEEEPVFGDYVLAGDQHVGEFLSDEATDDFDGEYENTTQPDYELLYDDLFPAGFGPEDIVFLSPVNSPKLDEDAFYLGGMAISEDDEYYEIDVDDLVEFDSAEPFVLIEGDNQGGLSPADWFFLTFDGAIDDHTIVLFKGSQTLVGGAGDEEEDTGDEEEDTGDEEEDTGDDTGDDDEMEGGEEEGPKEPGFEAIALIAALGAALVLVRRRN